MNDERNQEHTASDEKSRIENPKSGIRNRIMWQVLLLGFFALLYGGVVVPHLSVAYLDFGDGNYLYISSRLADGIVLYRDILAPQPPCHLLVGSFLIRVGRALGQGVETQLYTVRFFSVLLHLATMLVVWAIARRLFGRASAALWAAGLYLIIPVGFWWTLAYESESLEVFFLLLSFLLLIRWEKRSLAAAGLFGALAMATNMTAAPYVGWVALFLLWRDRRRAAWYITPAVAVVLVTVAMGEWLSDSHYLENVFFNQVGTFPHPDLASDLPPDAPFRTLRTILGYAFGKIAREGADVLALDGIFISAAVAGLLMYLGKTDKEEEKEKGERKFELQAELRTDVPAYHFSFVGWYALWSFLAIGFVAKGATMDYIFTIGEPFVCLFAAYAISEIVKQGMGYGVWGSGSERSARFRVGTTAVAIVGLIVLFARPVSWIHYVVRQQRAYEMNAAGVERVRSLIEEHSRAGDTILAAPYYAFIAHRNLIEEHSEFFIWHIKYLLEQQVEQKAGPATHKVQAIAAALRAKEIPVVVQEMDKGTHGPRQIFSIPEVRDAIRQNYQPLLAEPIEGLNCAINVLAPKR